MKQTWILIADSSRARIFTTDAPSSPLEELEGFSHAESRLHDREITSDLPGKIQGGIGGGHAFEQKTDPKKQEAINFAHSLAHHLEAGSNANQFEQLMIIADPSFLGLLRDELSEQVKKKLSFELDKDLTKHSVAEIQAHLPRHWPTL
jgi:protein required for attachment to host cells